MYCYTESTHIYTRRLDICQVKNTFNLIHAGFLRNICQDHQIYFFVSEPSDKYKPLRAWQEMDTIQSSGLLPTPPSHYQLYWIELGNFVGQLQQTCSQ